MHIYIYIHTYTPCIYTTLLLLVSLLLSLLCYIYTCVYIYIYVYIILYDVYVRQTCRGHRRDVAEDRHTLYRITSYNMLCYAIL